MILIKFIKKFKALFIQDRVKQEKINKSNKRNEIIKHPKIKSNDNTDIKSENELLCYESFGKLKVYRRPIIKEEKERERLHNQISEKLEKLS